MDKSVAFGFFQLICFDVLHENRGLLQEVAKGL